MQNNIYTNKLQYMVSLALTNGYVKIKYFTQPALLVHTTGIFHAKWNGKQVNKCNEYFTLPFLNENGIMELLISHNGKFTCIYL
jgi:hypothetical protein